MKSQNEKAYEYAKRAEARRLYDRTTAVYADGVRRRREWGGFAWFDMPAHTAGKMPEGERLSRPVAPVLDDVPIDHVDRVAWRSEDGRCTIPRALNWDGAHIPWDAYAESPEPEPANWRETVRRMARDAYMLTREIDSLDAAMLIVLDVSPQVWGDMKKRSDACSKRRDALLASVGRICADYEYTGSKADSESADMMNRRWIGYARNIVEEHKAAKREAAAVAREEAVNAATPEERQRARALAAAKAAERKRKEAEDRRYQRELELARQDKEKLCDHPITRWQVFAALDMLESRCLLAAIWADADRENRAWLAIYREWAKWIRENDGIYAQQGKYFGAGKNRRL